MGTTTRRPHEIILLVVLVAGCALQCVAIFQRGLDPDELEHLHAGYCVAHGQVPYRDFFEHHAPALYFQQRLVFGICGDDISVVWLNRLFEWGFSLGTLILTWLIARRSCSAITGLISACLLIWTTIFHFKGIELRPDVPSAFFLCFAVSICCRANLPSMPRVFSAGILVGVATAYTQKAVVPGAGLIIGLILQRMMIAAPNSNVRHRSRSLLDRWRLVAVVTIPFGIGFAVICGVLVAGFAASGALPEFLDSTVFQLMRWTAYSDRTAHLRPTLAADLTIWSLAIWETIAFVRNARTREAWTDGRGLLVVIASFCAFSLLWVKATYPQYFLLWMPCLAVLAGRRASLLLDDAATAVWPLARCYAVTGLLAIVQAGLLFRAVDKGPAGSLSHLFDRPDAGRFYVIAAVVILIAVLIAAAFTIHRNHRRTMLLLLAFLGTYHGLLRIADSLAWSNRTQIAGIRAVNSVTTNTDTVLDGFTGYGALRPHSYYYWWINTYSLSLMSPAEKDELLLQHLASHPPKVVLFDHELRKLPASVTRWIESNYRPEALDPIYLRASTR